MSKCWNEEKDTPDWPILLRDAVGHEVSNVAPVVAADRPARRDGTMQPPAALLPFFEVLATYDGPIPLSDLHAMVGSLTFTSDDLGDAIQIDTGGYVRTLVFERAHVEVLVMAWLPGQRSPIHDHAGSACGVRIVAGAARETIFTCRDDGFVEEWDERHLAAGSVTVAFDRDIHALGNAVPSPASPRDILVTLHIYSPPLVPTRKYEQAMTIEPIRSVMLTRQAP